MSNPYYNHGGVPAANTGPAGASAALRAEFDAIMAGFALLPSPMTQNNLVRVNAGGTALVADVVYASGEWNPGFTCATPGNLIASTSGWKGLYVQLYKIIIVNFYFSISTFTWSTASGDVQITGLPFAPAVISNPGVWSGAVVAGGMQNANYPQIGLAIDTGNFMRFGCFGSGQSRYFLQISDFPSGGIVTVGGTIAYQIP